MINVLTKWQPHPFDKWQMALPPIIRFVPFSQLLMGLSLFLQINTLDDVAK